MALLLPLLLFLRTRLASPRRATTITSDATSGGGGWRLARPPLLAASATSGQGAATDQCGEVVEGQAVVGRPLVPPLLKDS
jgi:hypothetical protein